MISGASRNRPLCREIELPIRTRARRATSKGAAPSGNDIGARLFAIVTEAVAAGVDPEGELRRTARSYRDAILAAEQA